MYYVDWKLKYWIVASLLQYNTAAVRGLQWAKWLMPSQDLQAGDTWCQPHIMFCTSLELEPTWHRMQTSIPHLHLEQRLWCTSQQHPSPALPWSLIQVIPCHLPSSLQDITFDAGGVTFQKYKANKDCVRSKLGNICIEEKGEYYKVTSRHNYRKGKMEDFTLWIFKGVTSLWPLNN